MIKLKNAVFRFFVLFACAGLGILIGSCAPDAKDKDLPLDLSFLGTYDYSKWTLIQDEKRVYIRFNRDMDKAIEMWVSNLEFSKLLGKDECFYYTAEMLNTEDIEILENSENKLEFTHQKNETWTFSKDKGRMKLVMKSDKGTKGPYYFSKSEDNFNRLNTCPDDHKKDAFDWKFLKE